MTGGAKALPAAPLSAARRYEEGRHVQTEALGTSEPWLKAKEAASSDGTRNSPWASCSSPEAHFLPSKEWTRIAGLKLCVVLWWAEPSSSQAGRKGAGSPRQPTAHPCLTPSPSVRVLAPVSPHHSQWRTPEIDHRTEKTKGAHVQRGRLEKPPVRLLPQGPPRPEGFR